MKESNIFKTISFLLFFLMLEEMSLAIPSPTTISDLTLTKAGNEIHFIWFAVTENAYGNPVTIDHYNIYRGTTPNFIPDFDTHSNLIAQTSDTSYTDTDALFSEDSYYYYVTAVTSDGTESLLPSNIGYKIRIPLTYNASGSNKHWLSLPYSTSYTTASDLGGDAPNIAQVIRWDPATQSEEVWDQSTGTGTNFPITPGEAYAVVISGDTVLNIVGAHKPATLAMNYNTGDFNVNWFSVPHPNAYGSASQMADAIPNATKVGRYDTQQDTYESWFYLDGTWMGEDFPLIPAEGYLAVTTENTTWEPSTGSPSVTAQADATDGLNSLTVNLSGVTSDTNGYIVNFKWDYEGDGTFDYADPSSPDSSFAYTSPGTYHPTLLITDNDGFRGYDYKTIEVYGLENTISVEDFNPSDSESAQFDYTVSDDGLMTIRIYDQDGTLVRTLVTDKAVSAGSNADIWDGKNDSNELVQDGTYYVVFEYTVSGNTYTYDMRTTTGGEDISQDITNIVVSDTLSPLEGQYVEIDYTLPEKSLVTIVVKDQSGSVIRNLLTEAPRISGSHTEIWDGSDEGGAIVEPGTSFFVTITATSIADNGLITKGFAPTLTDISASPVRFSPATNPYGTQDKSSVRAAFTLNKQADVTATVFDEQGTAVRTITEPGLPSGENQIAWNGRNDSGILLSDGLYDVQLRGRDSNGTYSDIFHIQVEIFY